MLGELEAEIESPKAIRSKVLIVDDLPGNLLSLESMLEILGVEVVQASSGAMALSEALNNDFALILLDVMMPVMDGIETAELLRSSRKTKYTPIVFVTAGSNDERSIFRGYESGAVDYLFKPLKPEIVRSKVKVFVELYEQKMRIIQAQKIAESASEALRESEETFRAITSSAQDSIIMIDDQSRISFWNDMAIQMFGYRREEAIGQDVIELLTPDRLIDEYRSVLQHYFVANVGTFIRRTQRMGAQHKDGIEFPVEVSFSDITLRGRKHVVSLIRDITLPNLFLERLKEAKLQAENANSSRGRFLSFVSHELRTPIHGILGSSDLLLSVANERGDDNSSQLIEAISQSGVHLLQMVNDLLDLDKVDAHAMDLSIESVHIEEHLEATIGMIQLEADTKNLSIDVNIDTPLTELRADPKRLRQVLLNLISNAVKYTPENASIMVLIVEVGNSMLKFSVVDPGVGIPASEYEHIFDEFYQVEQKRDSNFGGTGLGLPLTKRLVELQGGTIGVESKVGAGSTFWFTIPIRTDEVDVQASESDVPVVSSRSIEGKHILIVEDTEANVLILETILLKAGAKVTLATNGREAVEIAKSRSFDLILMDWKMPVMGGDEATRKLRDLPNHRETIIIATTGDAPRLNDDEFSEAGCTACIIKPFRITELISVIEENSQ